MHKGSGTWVVMTQKLMSWCFFLTFASLNVCAVTVIELPINGTGIPHPLEVEYSQQNFHKPKWHEAKNIPHFLEVPIRPLCFYRRPTLV